MLLYSPACELLAFEDPLLDLGGVGDVHAMSDLWIRSQLAISEAGTTVPRQFDLLVECLVLFHARRRELAFIAYSEIRSLNGTARTEHIAARDRQQRLMTIIGQGAENRDLYDPLSSGSQHRCDHHVHRRRPVVPARWPDDTRGVSRAIQRDHDHGRRTAGVILTVWSE